MLGRHSDIQEVHLCDLREVDSWGLVNSLSLNFQSLSGDTLTRLLIPTAMRFWQKKKPNDLKDKIQDNYEKNYRNLVLVELPWLLLWSHSDRFGKSPKDLPFGGSVVWSVSSMHPVTHCFCAKQHSNIPW